MISLIFKNIIDGVKNCIEIDLKTLLSQARRLIEMYQYQLITYLLTEFTRKMIKINKAYKQNIIS